MDKVSRAVGHIAVSCILKKLGPTQIEALRGDYLDRSSLVGLPEWGGLLLRKIPAMHDTTFAMEGERGKYGNRWSAAPRASIRGGVVIRLRGFFSREFGGCEFEGLKSAERLEVSVVHFGWTENPLCRP